VLFFYHIIINMDIDDDMMDVILNNQRVRLVGEMAGLNGMEYQPKGAHQESDKSWAIGGGVRYNQLLQLFPLPAGFLLLPIQIFDHLNSF